MLGFLVWIDEGAREKVAACRTAMRPKKRQGGILLTRHGGVNAMRALCGFSRENTDG
jgi:hypothetical protein